MLIGSLAADSAIGYSTWQLSERYGGRVEKSYSLSFQRGPEVAVTGCSCATVKRDKFEFSHEQTVSIDTILSLPTTKH